MIEKEALPFLTGRKVENASVIKRDEGDLLVLNLSGDLSLLIGFNEFKDKTEIEIASTHARTQIDLNRKVERESVS